VSFIFHIHDQQCFNMRVVAYIPSISSTMLFLWVRNNLGLVGGTWGWERGLRGRRWWLQITICQQSVTRLKATTKTIVNIHVHPSPCYNYRFVIFPSLFFFFFGSPVSQKVRVVVFAWFTLSFSLFFYILRLPWRTFSCVLYQFTKYVTENSLRKIHLVCFASCPRFLSYSACML